MTVYTLENVTFEREERVVLNDITLDVFAGEVLVLVGPNGAGKSTLLSALAGDIQPDSGTVLLYGRPLAQWPKRELARTRAVLTQGSRVAFAFTVRDVVDMGRHPWPADPKTDAELVQASIDRAGLHWFGERPMLTMSGGEQARGAFARVLAQDTTVVLLDEPTAALDLKHQEQVLATARDLATSGRAVVVVVHDLSLAGSWADRVAIIDGGELVAIGKPGEVLTAARITGIWDHEVYVLQDSDGRFIVVPRRPAPDQPETT